MIYDTPYFDANLIHGTLYQGAAPPRGSFLADKGFHVLVLTAKENTDASKFTFLKDVIVAPGDDDMRYERMMRFIPVWSDAARKVAAHVRAGRNVLVTCMAGQNRSGLVTALALQELTGWSGKKIVNLIQSRRIWALNNDTFARYIIDSFPDDGEE